MEPLVEVRHAAGSYAVFAGEGLLARAASLSRPRGAVFVVTSPSVRRYAEEVAASFGDTPLIVIDDGETNKTVATAYSIITKLIEAGALRDSMLVAVGGGVIGDTAGFAAAIFLRGIELLHVPTTLLAQVDSSIGGKVAVNHELGKNLIGAFHQPHAVIADASVLRTLTNEQLRSGMFETVKAGVIGDAALFERFETHGGSIRPTNEVVARAIAVKARIVSSDEREDGSRRLLNYGHTLGHAFETVSAYSITHGDAVAWGMIAANAIAVRRGVLDRAVAGRIDAAIRSMKPDALPQLDRRALLEAAARDKKNVSARRVMVLPRAIGECVIAEDITQEEIEYGIDSVTR